MMNINEICNTSPLLLIIIIIIYILSLISSVNGLIELSSIYKLSKLSSSIHNRVSLRMSLTIDSTSKSNQLQQQSSSSSSSTSSSSTSTSSLQLSDLLNSKNILYNNLNINNYLPISYSKETNSLYFNDDNRQYEILYGLDKAAVINFDILSGGVFIDFKWKNECVLSQHDAIIGTLTKGKLLSLSRIKRWWMAPFIGDNADDIPVETQLMLIETTSSYPLSSKTKENSSNFPNKKYILIAPLIDFNQGFRVTLFGKEGGYPAGRNILAARLESGDSNVCTSVVKNAIYIAAGSDPYKLLESSYSAISRKMETFRPRSAKKLFSGLNGFGFCTWDAFYSSVDADKVIQGIVSLQNAGVPPKFVIIDDGWQSTSLGGRHRSAKTDSLDGELSGAQIDGATAAKEMSGGNAVMGLLTQTISNFYSEYVEKGESNSWAVKLWAAMSKTVLRDQLEDFFALKTDFSKRLTSWKANSKFEDAASGKTFKQFIKSIKEKMGVEYVYVWHALAGYWGGLSDHAEDDFNQALNVESNMLTKSLLDAPVTIEHTNDNSKVSGQIKVNESIKVQYSQPTPHLLLVEPQLAWDPASLSGVGSVALHKLEEMYEKMHSYLADAGIDGVKVDAQAGIGTFGTGYGGGSALARACVTAVERSVKAAFTPIVENVDQKVNNGILKKAGNLVRKLPLLRRVARNLKDIAKVDDSPVGLVGCMCHSTENLLNFYETSLIRASDDFYPKDMAAQTVHLVSCAYNSVMLGEIATADWDMFHSRHPFAEMHAAARAVSGGPIYVSDSPGNHNPELLRKLVLSDGTILRPNLPARPTVDCLFSDVMSDGKTALKVWSLNDVSAVVGLFNVQGSRWDRIQRRYVHDPQNYPPRPIKTQLRPRDISGDFTEPMNVLDAAIEVITDAATGMKVSTATSKFIAWSAKNKNMILLKDRNSVIEYELKHKDWDVVSISKVYQIDIKKSLAGRILNIKSDRRSNSNDLTSSSSSSSSSSLSEILWSPIGMLDMLNCGGAIIEIINTKTPMTASFRARGPGLVGMYTNTKPKRITCDGKDIEFTITNKSNLTNNNNNNNNDDDDDNDKGLLVSFKLSEKQSNKSNDTNDVKKKITIDARVIVIIW